MNNKKITFFEYFILKVIVAATFLLLYFSPSAFSVMEDLTPDAIVICRGASLLMSIFTLSQIFDAIYKASLKN